MINPIKIDQVVFYRDVGFMIFITIILSLFSYTKGAQGKINRLEGMALLTLFLSYTTYLVINTKP
jgi:cation:H+ antiporter